MIVGVHTPEFAFEHVSSNVSGAIERLGVRYPVVQDNDFGIWNAYSNQYWPAEYLIDRQRPRPARALRRGRVRRDREADPQAARRRPRLDDRACATRRRRARSRRSRTSATSAPTASSATPMQAGPSRRRTTSRATLPLHHLAFGGHVDGARGARRRGPGARLRVHFQASKVYLVLGGQGQGRRLVDGKKQRDRARERRPALHARRLAAPARRAARAALHAGRLGLRVHVRLIEVGDERRSGRRRASRRRRMSARAVARRRSRAAPTDARRGTSSRGRRGLSARKQSVKPASRTSSTGRRET